MLMRKDIIHLIREDHRPLKAQIRILCSDESSEETKIKTLTSFLYDLELHSKAEERSLYKSTVEDSALRDAILEGFEEHALANFLTMQLRSSRYEYKWSDEINSKAKVLAELVKHHLDEEEDETLLDLRDNYSPAQLLELGEKYLEAREEVKEKMEQADNTAVRSLRHAAAAVFHS